MNLKQETNKAEKTQTFSSFKRSYSVVEGAAVHQIGNNSSERVEERHHIQLAQEVQAQFHLLEDLQQRKQFLLRETLGILKKS